MDFAFKVLTFSSGNTAFFVVVVVSGAFSRRGSPSRTSEVSAKEKGLDMRSRNSCILEATLRGRPREKEPPFITCMFEAFGCMYVMAWWKLVYSTLELKCIST